MQAHFPVPPPSIHSTLAGLISIPSILLLSRPSQPPPDQASSPSPSSSPPSLSPLHTLLWPRTGVMPRASACAMAALMAAPSMRSSSRCCRCMTVGAVVGVGGREGGNGGRLEGGGGCDWEARWQILLLLLLRMLLRAVCCVS